MKTFTLVHGVDYSTGKARVGKAHVVEKREEVLAKSWEKRIKQERSYKKMQEYYENNPDFKAYVDAYCKKHEIDVSEALTHAIVKEVYKAYQEGVLTSESEVINGGKFVRNDKF